MIETVRTRTVTAIFCIHLTASTSYASSEDAEKLKVWFEGCQVLVNSNTNDRETAELCTDAEADIRMVGPNSAEHVKVVELLGMLAGYIPHLAKDPEQYYGLALQAARTGFGHRSPETIESLLNLAALAQTSDNWASAREMSLEVLAAIGTNHPGALDEKQRFALDAIIMSFRLEKKLSPETYVINGHIQAETNLIKFLGRRSNPSRSEREDIAVALLEIGNLQVEAGQLEEAARTTQRAHSKLIDTKSGNWIAIAKKQRDRIAAMTDSGPRRSRAEQ